MLFEDNVPEFKPFPIKEWSVWSVGSRLDGLIFMPLKGVSRSLRGCFPVQPLKNCLYQVQSVKGCANGL